MDANGLPTVALAGPATGKFSVILGERQTVLSGRPRRLADVFDAHTLYSLRPRPEEKTNLTGLDLLDDMRQRFQGTGADLAFPANGFAGNERLDGPDIHPRKSANGIEWHLSHLASGHVRVIAVALEAPAHLDLRHQVGTS